MSEGRKCYWWEREKTVTTLNWRPAEMEECLAFTLPELAARDAQIRREALAPLSREEIRAIDTALDPCVAVDAILKRRALAEKGEGK